jgi:Short-chain dehydrogenases of various substrate specificities
MFEVNTLAHYWLAQESLTEMLEANYGVVVNAASLAGYTVRLNMVDYPTTSKAVYVRLLRSTGNLLLSWLRTIMCLRLVLC